MTDERDEMYWDFEQRSIKVREAFEGADPDQVAAILARFVGEWLAEHPNYERARQAMMKSIDEYSTTDQAAVLRAYAKTKH